MSKIDKIMFAIFVVITQSLQFLAVYSIAVFNSMAIEFLFIFFSFQLNRAIFGKSYHADKLSKCTLLSLIIFYFLIRGVIALNTSLFVAPMFGVYLAYILNQVQKLIDNQRVPKAFVRKPLREQILEILGNKIKEEEIEDICLKHNIHPNIAETVFLYLSNSKDDVADILDIADSTVIRRLKKFIEKMSIA